jgi:hypothetical protein
MKLLIAVCSFLAICLGQNQQVIIPEQPLFPTRVPFRRYSHQQCFELFYGCKDDCYVNCIMGEDQSRYFDESLGRHDQHSYCKDHCAFACNIDLSAGCHYLLKEQQRKDHEKDTRRYTSKNSKVISLEVPAAPKPILAMAIRNTTRQNR